MKLSIIVTAFNEEKYIDRCLKSLAFQETHFDYEVIIVNDGSTDHTQQIIDRYVKRFGRTFKSYERTNSGQGPSRNFGIKQSVGEYISFADADDWVAPSFVEQMCASAQKYQADVVICDVHKIYVDQKCEEDVPSFNHKHEKINIADYIRIGQSNSYSWNKIYRRAIWQHFKFKKMVYEDLDIVIPILSHCRIVTYVAAPLYNYYKHSGTTTSSYRNPRLFDIFTAYRDLLTSVDAQFISEAEFCVAKRMMINFDTPGFAYYLGYFIESFQVLHQRLLANHNITQDHYVKAVVPLAETALLPAHILTNGGSTFDSVNQYKFDETVMNLESRECTLSDFAAGGIMIASGVELASPLGYLRTLRDFVILGKNQQVIIAGFKPNSLLLQRLFLKKHHLNLQQVLAGITALVMRRENITFAVRIFELSDLNNKLVVKEV